MEILVATNGMHLEEHVHWLREINGLVVKLSLDSLAPSLFRKITGGGRIERVLKGVESARNAGIKVRLNAVLTTLNAFSLDPLLRLCRSLGCGLKLLDMFPVPETERIWRSLYFPPEALGLTGTMRSPDPYSQHYGIPTDELDIGGVHVRIKNSHKGTHYHPVCAGCKQFPCQEGFYCLVVTPPMTVLPCRLGRHLIRRCRGQGEVESALEESFEVYNSSQLANHFWSKYSGFYANRLAELRRV
jgi:MoaA/NifB/PqqE/SkfB family radical SAM enzyme